MDNFFYFIVDSLHLVCFIRLMSGKIILIGKKINSTQVTYIIEDKYFAELKILLDRNTQSVYNSEIKQVKSVEENNE